MRHGVALAARSQATQQIWLVEQLQTGVTLVWTMNRSSMLSVRGNPVTGYRVRLHQLFHQAPKPIWEALVAYIRDADSSAAHTLRTYIRGQHPGLDGLPAPGPHERSAPPQGQYFDLADIYCTLNATYFASQVQAEITWSRRPPRRRRTSIRFGAYYPEERLIRIHPFLDQSFVPKYVVENVVFHEMLHQIVPRQYSNGRWSVHPPAFRQQERCFLYYTQAQQWQHQHLSRLLRSE
jgi:hypothetical protein